MLQVLAVVFSYFLGGVLTAGMIASSKRIDLKKKGSGNPGATNAFRVFGAFYGILTLLGDAAKGVLAVIAGMFVGGTGIAALCGLAVVIGHIWPVLHGFQGGKGIATSLGVIIVLMPQSLPVVIPLWILVLLFFGYVSLASIAAAVALPITGLFFYPGQGLTLLFSTAAAILVIYRHWPNMQRLVAGKEDKFRLIKRGREDIS